MSENIYNDNKDLAKELSYYVVDMMDDDERSNLKLTVSSPQKKSTFMNKAVQLYSENKEFMDNRFFQSFEISEEPEEILTSLFPEDTDDFESYIYSDLKKRIRNKQRDSWVIDNNDEDDDNEAYDILSEEETTEDEVDQYTDIESKEEYSDDMEDMITELASDLQSEEDVVEEEVIEEYEDNEPADFIDCVYEIDVPTENEQDILSVEDDTSISNDQIKYDNNYLSTESGIKYFKKVARDIDYTRFTSSHIILPDGKNIILRSDEDDLTKIYIAHLDADNQFVEDFIYSVTLKEFSSHRIILSKIKAIVPECKYISYVHDYCVGQDYTSNIITFYDTDNIKKLSCSTFNNMPFEYIDNVKDGIVIEDAVAISASLTSLIYNEMKINSDKEERLKIMMEQIENEIRAKYSSDIYVN